MLYGLHYVERKSVSMLDPYYGLETLGANVVKSWCVVVHKCVVLNGLHQNWTEVTQIAR